MFDNLKKSYHSSLFRKSITAVRKKPLLLLYVVLLDIGFFTVFYLLNILLNKFLPENPEIATAVNSQTVFSIIILLISILYFVIIILVYSFFNLIILGNIRKMSNKYSHNLSMFKNMFFLNLLLFIILFIFLSLFNYLTILILNKPLWLATILFVILFAVLIFFYAFHNFSHSALILGHRLKNVIKNALKNTFSRSYVGVILFSFIFMAVYFGLYILLGLLVDNFIIKNYDLFINTSSIITIIIAYVLFTFNRIYFFFIAEKKIGIAK